MSKTGQTMIPLLALCIIGVTVFLTMDWISPPGPLPVDVPTTDFSADRAVQDLKVIAQEPHPMGISPAHAEVRDYLLGEIRALGLEPQVQNTFGVRVVEPGFVLGGFVENILVRLPGTDPEGAVLLSSHYDTTPVNPGGGCSSSGIVTILEILRALQAGPPLRQDVIVLFTDGEEPGTVGAHAFVDQHPWLADVRLVINMDQFWVGPPHLFRTSKGNGALIQTLARSSSSTKPAYVSFPFDLFPSGETDLVPFALAGVAGADISTTGQTPESHTALEFPDVVDPGSLQQAGNQMLALVRYLGDQPTLEMSVPDQTFFPVLGRLVHYPSNMAWLFATLAGLCFLGTLYYGFKKRAFSWSGLGLGFLAFLLGLVFSVLVINLLWLGLQSLHPEYGYSVGRPVESDDHLYAISFFVLMLAIVMATVAVARMKVSSLDLAAGTLVIWFPLTVATTILLPATSYLFTWVLLFSSLALLLVLFFQNRKNGWVLSGFGYLASAILGIFLWIPLFYIGTLGEPLSSGLLMFSLFLVTAALWFGSIIPILDWITSPKRWLSAITTLMVAMGFLVAGHFLVGRDSPPPWVNPIGYWLDTKADEAYWVAFSDELDERQNNLLLNPVQRSYNELFSEAPHYSVLTSTAPILDKEGPHLEVLDDQWAMDHRRIKAKITTSLHARVYIIIPKESPLLAITVPYNERTVLPPVDDREWVLRFDGMPEEGIEVSFEFSKPGPVHFLLVDEMTGLPSFPGLSVQPEPGTMQGPGEFYQGIPTDFTAINRNYVIQSIDR